jgi:archaellum biogenesis ATPase FlaH
MIDVNKLTLKQFISTKPSLYTNLQNYIKNGKELLHDTDFSEIEHGDKVKNQIITFIERANKLLKGEIHE